MLRRILSSSTPIGSYPEPSDAQCASALKVTGATRNTISLSWTAGASDARYIIIASPAVLTAAEIPHDFISNYTADASYTYATDLNNGTTSIRVVYDGNATAMTVSGLSANKPYYFRIFTYFADAGITLGSRNYNTSVDVRTAARTTR